MLIFEINNIATKAIEGELSNIDAYSQLDELEKVVKAAKEKVKDAAYKEVENSGEKVYKGFTCTSKAVYNYSHIEQWNWAKKLQSEIEEKAKAALKFKLDASSETGETIEPAMVTYSYYLKASK